MKRYLFGALIVGLGVAVYFGGEPWLRHHLEASVRDGCGTCEVAIGRVGLQGFALALDDVILTRGAEDVRHRYRAVLTKAVITPAWRALLSGRLHLTEVVLDGLQVTMIDRAEGRHVESAEAPAREPDWRVDRVRVRDASFTYVRDRKNTHAVVAFRKLNAQVDVEDGAAHAKVTGQLGFSGEMRLDLKMRSPSNADVELWFNDQNLADLSAFFEPNAGVKLSGQLMFAHATSRLRGTGLTTTARAVFDDFDLEVTPTTDRDGWTAFFTNLGISIGIKQSNVDLKAADQTRQVELARRPRETLVAFLLRGIKDAMFSVAKKPAARALTE